jgi:hypothetical protein
VTASVENLFGCAWNEPQFVSMVRLHGLPPAPVAEVQFTPGTPRRLQLGLEYRF